MTQKIKGLTYGPGGTHWEANEDGSISKCRHNDKGWCSHFATAHQLTPRSVARMLRDAYLEGMDDGKEQVRRVLGVVRT